MSALHWSVGHREGNVEASRLKDLPTAWSTWFSTPVLALAFAAYTILAIGSLTVLDEAMHENWSKALTPSWHTFLDTTLDNVAGQIVCLPVLVGVAILLAIRYRTARPLLIAAGAEIAFFIGIGLLKLLLARTATKTGEAGFFSGGVLEHGWYGMSYPSGHSAEAILIYGTVLYLLWTYVRLSRRTWHLLLALNAAIAINAVGVSYYLGYHWISDLVGGLLAGALMLRLVIDADQRLTRSWRRARARQPVPPNLVLAERVLVGQR